VVTTLDERIDLRLAEADLSSLADVATGTVQSGDTLVYDAASGGWAPAVPLRPLDLYPVGSVYLSTTATNPSAYFGGTWVAYGQGRVLVGVDAADPDFDAAGKTGGAKTHTLTVAEMPSHTHAQDPHTHTQQPHRHTPDEAAAQFVANRFPATSSRSFPSGSGNMNANGQVHTGSTTAVNNLTTATNQDTGGGAHNNLQPYLTTYMFTRTA
jgi:microcystin-dependent protein